MINDVLNVTVFSLAQFSSHGFELFSPSDVAVLDAGDTAENIAYKEEKEKYSDSYFTDVNLKGSFKCGEKTINVSGVAKGIYITPDDEFFIDFVKSLKFPPECVKNDLYDMWLSPYKCLAYLLSCARRIDKVGIRAVFIHTETLEKKTTILRYNKVELQEHFVSLLNEYVKWENLLSSHIEERNAFLQNSEFPYPEIRDGQDIMINEVTSAISDFRPVFINAPTGIGKTAAVLYPALQSLANGHGERIFYLTSRNSLHSVVHNYCKRQGATIGKLRVLSVVSKSKLCPFEKHDCKRCSLSKGHGERLKDALFELVSNESCISSDVVLGYAERFGVCPFQLSRHAARFSDVVICDYNYIFDPYVSKVDLFSSRGKDIILVDEAHNLVDRTKEMYSCTLNTELLLEILPEIRSVDEELFKSIKRFSKLIDNISENDFYLTESLDKASLDNVIIRINEVFLCLQRIIKGYVFETLFEENIVLCEKLQKLFSHVKRFVELADMYTQEYVSFVDEYKNMRIILADTGKTIRRAIKKRGVGVYFSATLSPEEYYRYMLGASDKDVYLSLDSPFPKENFKVVSYSLSTRYLERIATLKEVVRVIYSAISQKNGNYMVFLPSYAYLKALAVEWKNTYPEIEIAVERSGMKNDEKEEFVSAFNANNSSIFLAFAVMGGNFAEGIDLAGDKLSGAVIVGLGVLPPERSREMTCAYFNDRFLDGAKFAYMYSGMNKVFQAGGRVIRSEKDKGFLVVVDDRFLTEDYLEHLPDSWKNIERAKSAQMLSTILKDFWSND